MTELTPIESEFATSDEAEAHDAWFRAKIAMAIASDAGVIPHDTVMADARGVIEKRRDATGRLAR